MPKKFIRKSRKRTYKRKAYKARPSYGLRALTAPSKIVRMRYVQPFKIDPGTAGVVGIKSFYSNGLYNPDVAVAGTFEHQPYTFDQWMTYYASYEVLGFKAKITVASVTGSGNPMLIIASSTKDAPVSAQSWAQIERGRGRSVVVQSDNKPKVLIVKGNPRRIITGKSKGEVTGLYGTSSTNPSLTSYLNITCQDLFGAEDIGGMQGMVQIDYLVRLTSAIEFSQS